MLSEITSTTSHILPLFNVSIYSEYVKYFYSAVDKRPDRSRDGKGQPPPKLPCKDQKSLGCRGLMSLRVKNLCFAV